MPENITYNLGATANATGKPWSIAADALAFKVSTTMDRLNAWLDGNPASGSGGAGTGTGGGSTGGGGNVPTDANSYPLAVPTVAAGADMTFGSGPDTITIVASNNPGSKANAFNVIAKGGHFGTATEIAAAIPMTASTGQGGGQTFTIKGVFRDLTELDTTAAGPWDGPWFNSVQVNGVQYACTGGFDSRGGQTVNQQSIFVSNGANSIPWTPYKADGSGTGAGGTGTGVPAATLTLINGKTLSDLVAATAAGSTATLPAETIFGTAAISTACTIAGAGPGKTIIDAKGVSIAGDKGVLEPTVAGATITNLTLQNASGPSGNEAGIRASDDGIPIVATNVEITGCFNGILTESGDVTLDSSHVHGNGIGPGNTHNIYASLSGNPDPNSKLTVTNSVIERAVDGHEIKSRHATTTVANCQITTGGNGACMDIPEGGYVNVSNTTLTLGAGATTNLYTYSFEGGRNITSDPHTFTTDWNGVKIASESGTTPIIQSNSPVAILNLTGCTYTGPAPIIRGFATVNGTLAAG